MFQRSTKQEILEFAGVTYEYVISHYLGGGETAFMLLYNSGHPV